MNLGFVLGFVFGGRAARDAYQMELKRQEERKKVKAEREAKRAARAAGAGESSDKDE